MRAVESSVEACPMHNGRWPRTGFYKWHSDCLKLLRVQVRQSGHDIGDGRLIFRIFLTAFLGWLEALTDDPVRVPMGSTPLTRTVLKEPKTSDLAEQLYDAFVGYETAQYSRTDPLALHQVSGTIDEQHARA